MSPRLVSTCFALAAAGCSLEVPDGEPTLDQGRPALTIYQIQDESAEGHPAIEDHVRVRNAVVTAVDRFDEDGSGDTGTVFVQEAAGGPFSGIQLFRPTIQPANEYLLPGDVVEIEGTYLEFELGQINPEWIDETGRTISQLGDGIVRKTGEWLAPDPSLVEDPADLAEDPTGEGWEGVLVEVRDVEATGNPNGRGTFPITGGAEVEDDNFGIEGVRQGTRFARLAGVTSYIYTYKVLPRSPLDVEIESAAPEE